MPLTVAAGVVASSVQRIKTDQIGFYGVPIASLTGAKHKMRIQAIFILSFRFPCWEKTPVISFDDGSLHLLEAHTEAGSDPRGHPWVTWGVYLWAGRPPLADIILSHPPDLT